MTALGLEEDNTTEVCDWGELIIISALCECETREYIGAEADPAETVEYEPTGAAQDTGCATGG